MRRHTSYSRVLLAVLATVLLLGLLATAGAGTAAAAQSTHSSSIAPSLATSHGADYQVNVTKTYSWSPSDGGVANVTFTIENPELLDRAGVHNMTIDASDRTNADPGTGVVSTGNDSTYAVTGDTDEAVVRFQNVLNDTPEIATDQVAHVEPLNLPGGCARFGARGCGVEDIVTVGTDAGAEVSYHYAYEVNGTGFVTSGNSEGVATLAAPNIHDRPYDPLIVIGNYTMHNASAGGTTVTVVVPDGLQLRTPPKAIAESVADGATAIEVGNDTGQRYLLALDEFENYDDAPKGYTAGINARWAKFQNQLPARNVFNPQLHEYVHTTDRVKPNVFGDMWWFTEGYASYRTAQIALEQGYGDYDLYRNFVEEGRGNESGNAYHRGTLILAAVDRQIRLATDGNRTIAPVIEEMMAEDYTVSVDEFQTYVANVSNQTVGQRAADWASNESHPDTWSLAEHQSVFGPVSDPEYETASITSTSDRGTATIDTDRPVAVRENAELGFTIDVSNEGAATATYRASLREFDGTPFNGSIPTSYDRTNGTVGGGGQTTAGVSHTFQSTGHRAVEVGPPVADDRSKLTQFGPTDAYNVTVVEENATIVREHGPHNTTNTTAIVGPDTSTVVYQGAQQGTHLWETRHVMYDTGPDGVYEFDPDSWISPGETKRVRFGRYGEWGYVSSLAPVDGAVPTDPDDDGLYEDIDGDGTIEEEDATALFQHTNDPEVTDYVPAYDYNDNGRVDLGDVTLLYDEAQ